jgi:hypothetical protein
MAPLGLPGWFCSASGGEAGALGSFCHMSDEWGTCGRSAVDRGPMLSSTLPSCQLNFSAGSTAVPGPVNRWLLTLGVAAGIAELWCLLLSMV